MAASNVHISALADPNLAQIFKNLPPFYRLRVSAVCRRWWVVSRDPWRDVTHLELGSVPNRCIGAIVRMCPNLTSLYCKDQELILDDLKSISLSSLKTMELHGCRFYSYHDTANKDALPLFRSAHGQSMEELVLHEHIFGLESRLSERYSQRLLPASLKRLQLSDLNRNRGFSIVDYQANYLTELCKLRSLDSLILHSASGARFSQVCERLVFTALSALKSLRELLLPEMADLWVDSQRLAEMALGLPKLEILFLPKDISRSERLRVLFLKHPTLRVIVIPAYSFSRKREVQVPIRNRFRDGLAAKPLPFLHVFVGQRAAELFRFADAPENWLRVHRIDVPFPALLERAEIAEIFEGSWIAEQIKKEAKRLVKFWKYESGLVEST